MAFAWLGRGGKQGLVDIGRTSGSFPLFVMEAAVKTQQILPIPNRRPAVYDLLKGQNCRCLGSFERSGTLNGRCLCSEPGPKPIRLLFMKNPRSSPGFHSDDELENRGPRKAIPNGRAETNMLNSGIGCAGDSGRNTSTKNLPARTGSVQDTSAMTSVSDINHGNIQIAENRTLLKIDLRRKARLGHHSRA